MQLASPTPKMHALSPLPRHRRVPKPPALLQGLLGDSGSETAVPGQLVGDPLELLWGPHSKPWHSYKPQHLGAWQLEYIRDFAAPEDGNAV